MLIRYEHTYNQAISIRLSEANGPATIRMDLELGEHASSWDTIGPPAEVTMVTRVRALIEALLPAGRCSIVQVARSLGVDRRTVQRRLADSGETFSSRNRAGADGANGRTVG
jgi:AraC-like DNA-binding protein